MKNEKMSVKLPDGSELIAEKETGTDNPGIKIFCKYGNGSYDEAAFAEYEPTGKIGKHLKVGAFNNYCDDPKYYEDFSVCVNLSFKELLSVYEKNCGDDLNCEVKDGMVSVYTANKELIYHDFYYDNHSNHHGHHIQLAAYKSKEAIYNLSIECLDCNEVVYSVDNDEFVHDEEDDNCVYAVIQDWASDYELGNDMDLFSDENDAKNYFEKMIADDEESGIAEGIKNNPDFVSERSNDSYECYVEGYYCKDHYSIRIEKKTIKHSLEKTGKDENVPCNCTSNEIYLCCIKNNMGVLDANSIIEDVHIFSKQEKIDAWLTDKVLNGIDEDFYPEEEYGNYLGKNDYELLMSKGDEECGYTSYFVTCTPIALED